MTLQKIAYAPVAPAPTAIPVAQLQIGTGIGQPSIPVRPAVFAPCPPSTSRPKPGYEMVCDTVRGKWRQVRVAAPVIAPEFAPEFAPELPVMLPTQVLAPPAPKKGLSMATIALIGGAGLVALYLITRRRT